MFGPPAWALVAAHKLPEMLELCQQEVFTNQNGHPEYNRNNGKT